MLRQRNLKIFTKFTRKAFTDAIVPKQEVKAPVSNIDVVNDISRRNTGLSSEVWSESQRVGADLYVNSENLKIFKAPGFYFSDVNTEINLDRVASKGLTYKYFKNMLLFQEYDSLFRDFLQDCARFDQAGLKLACEPRLFDYIKRNLETIRKNGYVPEIDSLKVKFDYSVLRTEIYKNLSINRYQNKPLSDYIISESWTPLGRMVVAKEANIDYSFITVPRPFILANTMLVKTPMKIAIYNQNMSKKLYGHSEEETVSYVVRFEHEFNAGDFSWILPTQNKPSRLRRTKIADFNNILRGNPLFEDKWDLLNDQARFKYMSQDDELDQKVVKEIRILNQANKE